MDGLKNTISSYRTE